MYVKFEMFRKALHIGEGRIVTCIKTSTPYRFMIGSSQITSFGKHGMFETNDDVKFSRTSNVLIVFYFKTLCVE
jgi:hypothetical protein